jgi:valyl-tRNA synthetase
MVTSYPSTNTSLFNPKSEEAIQTVIEIIHALRNTRAQHQVENTKLIEAHIYTNNQLQTIHDHSRTIEALARTQPLNIHRGNQEVYQGNFISLILTNSKIIIPMESLIDVEVERQRLEREIKQNRTLANRLEAKLRNEAFLEKAPNSIINQERQKLASITTRLTQLEEQITIYNGERNV